MQLRELIEQQDEQYKRYEEAYEQKLIELATECGLYGVDVIANGMRGVIKVEKPAERYYVREIKFYPYKKDGNLSSKSKYVSLIYFSDYTDEKIKEVLKSAFRPAMEGDK